MFFPYLCAKLKLMKKLLILIILLCSIASLHAQEITFWGKVNYFLTKPAVVDTARILQRPASFSIGLFTTGQKAGFHADVNFGIDMYDFGWFSGVSKYSISENICKKIGLEVGYGNVNLGYGIEVGPKSAWKKSAFAFNILGKSWGVHLNYFKISNQFKSSLTIGTMGSEGYMHFDTIANELALLSNFTIDGYYVFNNKRFAYPAAYKMSLIQRHTTGSWMLTARYMQGFLYNSPEGAMDSYNMVDCFNTMQASIGGGYSVNFVLWHKDPVGLRSEGLRNLTINLTAMPVITVFNYLKTITYEYNENGQYSSESVSRVLCYPMPNFIGGAAVSLTLGRIYFSTQFTYNWFYFRSNDAFNEKHLDIPEYLDDLHFQGSFHNWILKGLLVYKF